MEVGGTQKELQKGDLGETGRRKGGRNDVIYFK